MKKISAPLEVREIKRLKVGEEILISGIIYTARDQAHKRLTEAIKKGRSLPIDLKGAVIYYCGPTGAPKGRTIGSCGPTTASRMDEFTPILLKAGLKGMIGKGRRSKDVVAAIKKYRGAYFLTYAGCGALLSRYIKEVKLLAYPDLGPEAIYEFKVEDFPAIVGIDTKGKDIYT